MLNRLAFDDLTYIRRTFAKRLESSPSTLSRELAMYRRDLIQKLMLGTAGYCSLVQSKVSHAWMQQDFDRYGGWTGKKFKATGFFRVEKDRRWWLVTPDGNAFLSFGINHLYPDLFNQDFSRQAWQSKLGIQNLNAPEFAPALREWFLATCKDFGFNTVGVHNALRIVNSPKPVMPYMQPIHFVDIPHWKTEIPDENFHDVFAPEFASHCDKLARQFAEPVSDDPLLLGYSMTDCPLLTEEDCRERPDVIGGARRPARIGWPRRLRNFGANAAGKRAYVQTVKELYRGEIDDFNETYGTRFESFDSLAVAENWRTDTDLSNGNETRDNVEFLKRVVAQYYQTAKDAISKYDDHHLFFGDKINANTDTLDTVLPTIAQYTDLVFYQMYARYEVQKPGLDRWSKQVDLPFVNGDSAFTMVTGTMPRPYGPVADNLQQRAAWTAEFFERAFARPDFVGWHYCGLIDATNQVARKRDRQHSGLIDAFGEPYPQLMQVIKSNQSRMYEIAQAAS